MQEDDDVLQIDLHPSTQEGGNGSTAKAAPTAALFGWFGATPRQLKRYKALYAQSGYNTVLASAPLAVIFAPTLHNASVFTLRCVRALARAHAGQLLAHGTLVCHFFSNGGAFIAHELSALLLGRRAPGPHPSGRAPLRGRDASAVDAVARALRAVVFDSAPCYMHERHGAAALATGVGLPPSERLATALKRATVMQGHRLYDWLRRTLVCDVAHTFWAGMRDARYGGVPETYVYSRADALLDVARLERLIAERARRGADVSTLCVPDAPHVQILRTHPRAYAREVRRVAEHAVRTRAHRGEGGSDAGAVDGLRAAKL